MGFKKNEPQPGFRRFCTLQLPGSKPQRQIYPVKYIGTHFYIERLFQFAEAMEWLHKTVNGI